MLALALSTPADDHLGGYALVGLNERRSPKRGRVQLTQLKKTPKRQAS